MFDDEVEAIIIAQGKQYDKHYDVLGSREHHNVRYHIDSGLNMLVQPFSQATQGPARNATERWYYHFDDILKANSNWDIYALLDDRGERAAIWENPHSTSPIEGMVKLVKWSQRERFVQAIERTSVT